MEFETKTLDRAERLVEVPQAPARGNALHRHPPEILAQFDEQPVLEAVERRKIYVAALRLDHLVAPGFTQ